MREILFKARTTKKHNEKHAFDNVWVEGDLIRSGGKYYIHPTGNKVNVDGELGKIIVMHEIDPTTLCQYTGLMDKNGRRIWENDICEMVYDGKIHIYVVVWDKTELDFKGTNGKENYGRNFEYLGCCEEIVVIGNIFDNADLLEVE